MHFNWILFYNLFEHMRAFPCRAPDPSRHLDRILCFEHTGNARSQPSVSQKKTSQILSKSHKAAMDEDEFVVLQLQKAEYRDLPNATGIPQV